MKRLILYVQAQDKPRRAFFSADVDLCIIKTVEALNDTKNTIISLYNDKICIHAKSYPFYPKSIIDQISVAGVKIENVYESQLLHTDEWQDLLNSSIINIKP